MKTERLAKLIDELEELTSKEEMGILSEVEKARLKDLTIECIQENYKHIQMFNDEEKKINQRITEIEQQYEELIQSHEEVEVAYAICADFIKEKGLEEEFHAHMSSVVKEVAESVKVSNRPVIN